MISLLRFLTESANSYLSTSDPENATDDPLTELELTLIQQGLTEEHAVFITEQGERFIGRADILAQKLSIDETQAKNALYEYTKYTNTQISEEEIKMFEQLVNENPKNSLEEIALLNDINQSVVSGFLGYIERNSINESDRLMIKEKFDAGFSIPEISNQLRISQKKVREFLDGKYITFGGIEGQLTLEIINHHFGMYPIMKLRELIITKDVKLQEQICFQLPIINERQFRDLKQYFMKFEESQNFFEINESLSIEAKECIRASSFEDVQELSKSLNRMEKVIKYYLLQYYPDESLMVHYKQEQLKQILNLFHNFGMDGQISHTTYRIIITESFDNLIKNTKKPKERPMLILKELLPLAFYYLKCSLPLEEFSHMITNITNISLTTLDIFHLIFQMSDPIVRGLCIEHYSFSNPVPLYYPQLGPYSENQTSCQFEICKELWYSLKQFHGFVSFGLGWASWNPIGKSHLLDLMFETDFVKGSPQNSAFHLSSVDIQMTKNLFGNKVDILEPTEWAYIDCHGCSDLNFITKICRNLDIVLIHVTYTDFKENYSRLEQDIFTMTVNAQSVYLLVRDYPETVIKANQKLIRGKSCTVILIPNLAKLSKNICTDLKELGYEIVHSTTGTTRLVDSLLIENLTSNFDTLNLLNKDKELIQRIMNHIYRNDINKGEYFSLSHYPYFIEYMRCYYKASNETDQKVIDSLNEECAILDKDLNCVEKSEIVWYFNDIIAQENSTLILWKLAQELSMFEGKYTLEILWREALLSNKYNEKIDGNEACRFNKEFPLNFSNHVERGESFELIDGDNLRFFNQDIDALLCEFHERQSCIAITSSNRSLKRPPIVISIFGPQSSGKSTLLNYCFGCKFLTSAGRCTKGVYGSLSKLSQPLNHSDHFLILDTEGLDSIEKGKVLKETSCIQFDRTMVLFCLAVSQVVIINVKGEIGEEMRNLLQICAYSLNKLKVSKVSAPKIFFVLNQQADPDPKKHLNSINTLLEDLNRESYLMDTEGLTISDLIQVSKDDLFVLPSAFNYVSVNTQMAKLFDSDLDKLSPTFSFANKCADLRMSIIHQLECGYRHGNQTPFTTMSEWMEMSGVIWDTIVTYQDIVKYRSVDEIKCSNSLAIIVSNLLKNKIYFYRDEYRRITEHIIETIKNFVTWSPPNGILEDVKKELDEIFKEKKEKALIDFSRQCQADSLLKRMNYMCDDAKLNLNRLIYMEKKIYEDKLRFEVKAKMTELKLSENMMKFQESIEKNADNYLKLKIEDQKKEFEKVWLKCFDSDNREEEEAERDEMFSNLYSVFRMESKTMEKNHTIYTRFRDLNFDMDGIIQTLRNEIISQFCTEPNAFAGMEQFFYHWRENKVPMKEMTPYPGKIECEYLSMESLWLPPEIPYTRSDRKIKLTFQKWVPPSCHSLIQYCSGYYNHPDIIWNLEKRKQVLLLASQLKDPNNLQRSTWIKFVIDISEKVTEFIENDPNISHSTVKEIVNYLCNICRMVNYEINYIEAKLTNTAERTITVYAFAFAFKSLLEIKTQQQKEDKSEEDKKKETNLKYFLQKVENRKITLGNWNRIKMRKGDQTIANKFAQDLLEALWRSVNTTCEKNLYEEYFVQKLDILSHKSLLLLANKKMNEKLTTSSQRKPITENSFVVQFICNHAQNQKTLFQDEWMNVAHDLHDIIVKKMKNEFIKQITTIRHVLTELLHWMVDLCNKRDSPERIELDSDSNFMVVGKSTEKESSCNFVRRGKVAPFKSMVIFLKMYLNPKVSPEELNQFFNNTFEVDGITMEKNHGTYVLRGKPLNPAHVLDEDLFQKLTEIKMFSSSETIFNIKVYVEEFLRTLLGYKFQVTKTDYKNLLKSTRDHFETRVINCPYQCPSCGKFCEREIHPHSGECQIMTGHQICSMGGKVWKSDSNRTAVLLMCEDYKDDMQVIIPGQNMKWWEFKQNCGKLWDWDLPNEEMYVALQMENREKMIKIWNKFGRAILQYYANRRININYIPYTTPEAVYRSLFLSNSYVCFVIDGTYLMSGSMKYVKRWVSDLLREQEETANFSIIVYHGHCLDGNCVDIFPNNLDFTSDIKSIQKFLGNIETYSEQENEFPMLHGLATAFKCIKWESGYEVRNQIVHIYVEPTNGCFNAFTARGQCNQGCSFVWKRDIFDKMKKLQIEYKCERLIPTRHPDFTHGVQLVDYDTPFLKLDCVEESKSRIFINYKPDN